MSIDDITIFHILNTLSDTSTSNEDEEEEIEYPSSSSSSESECSSITEENVISIENRELHRTLHFVKQTVPKYNDTEFKAHFRMNRTTCDLLIEKVIKDSVLPSHTHGRPKIDTTKACLMTIWYLSNTETFREISDRFSVTKSSAYRTIDRIITYLVRNSEKYIHWPKESRKTEIRSSFQKAHGIKNVIGAIDSNHIRIRKPINVDAHLYCNNKSQYSILMQGVCDHEKKFTNFTCGEPGSISDAKLLKGSTLYAKCINGFMADDILLGDSEYPCLSWLITPFDDNGNLSQSQKLFNECHSAVRAVIGNAFKLLKGRFRRLSIFNNENITFAVKCVIATAILHNICIDLNDEIEIDYTKEDYEGIVVDICEIAPFYTKRTEMCKAMFPELATLTPVS